MKKLLSQGFLIKKPNSFSIHKLFLLFPVYFHNRSILKINYTIVKTQR